MLKRLLFSVGFSLVFGIGVFAQIGTLQGVITDKSTKEPIPFANVVAMVSGLQKGGSTTDFDGNYTIKPLEPGVYDVVVSYMGYHTQTVSNARVIADQIVFVNVELTSETIDIGLVEIIEYEVPLIQKDKTQSGGTITSEEIDKMPERSIAAVATTVGGVFSRDGEVGSIRGQRSSGTVYYIDGIRVTGSMALPASSYDQISVILGGVPAQYGDVTGGVVSITTKGPSREFGMGVEYTTSGFGEKKGLDPYGYNRVDINLTGPLIKSKNPNDPSAILGYFLAADATYRVDGAPRMNGVYVANDDYLDYLLANPIRLTDAGTGVWHNASFVTEEDIHLRKSTPNTPAFSTSVQGKIDIKTTPNMNLSVGGNYNYNINRGYSFNSTMFNSMSNIQNKSQTWRVYGRLYHRFKTNEESALQNVFYQLQFDYTRTNSVSQDVNHKDNLFNYGYVGKYERSRYRQYEEDATVTVNIDGQEKVLDNIRLFTGYVDSLVTFTRGELNPYMANYMDQYYKLFPNSRGEEVNYYTNTNDIQAAGGFLNGDGPSSIYGLFAAPGTLQTSGYSESYTQQFGVSFRLNADIKKHALQFGFQFEQRISSSYGVGASALWTYMRQFTNTHISELDLDNPVLLYDGNVFLDQIDYNFLYNESAQYKVDKSLRNLLGLSVDGADWIDTDSYDPVSNTMRYYDEQGNPVTKALNGNLSIDMFSTDELLDNGLVAYRGYDAYGNRMKGSYSVQDFLTEKDANGYFTRPIGASRPIYGAIYIQDIFSFRDLIFNVGVRVDRFDANQAVLADPYLLFEANTIGDLKANPNEYGDFINALPSNMGDDYVVYVDNVNDPGSIKGFRSGSTWYDDKGLYITDPETVLDAGNGISPFLKNPENTTTITEKVFTDYKPQYNIMPRIAFSFPISDEALFFAHYDILTQRPTYASTLSIADYYYMPSKGAGVGIANPNLKPETTIEYEVGFQQRLTATSALSLSAFYRELRDQIQIYRFTGAYPRTYYSYENLDFGTIKGLTVSYDLRRTKNVRIRASYTLQFANGTGSDPDATAAIVTSGQPNLRTLTPTNDDQRHRITLNLDYRFGEGKRYNGPVTKRKNKEGEERNIYWLQNTGLNISFQGGTGTPYTKAKEAYSLITGQRVIDGSINGSRMPAFFRCDIRLDRDFNLTPYSKGRPHYLNVYLQILNLFNSKNVLSVYSFTGNPDNDGYLSDERFTSMIQQELNEASFRLLYSIRCDNPANYAGPRVIRLGVSYNF